MSGQHLVWILRICQSRTAKDNRVNLAIPNRLLRNIRFIHAASCQNWDINSFFCFRCQFHQIPFRHIHRRTGIIERIVNTCIHIQAIIAIGFQQLCDLNPFFQGTSNFLLTGQACLFKSFHKSFQSKTHADWKITAAFLLNTFQNFLCRPQTIFQAAAIFVGTVVHHGQGKLVKQIPPVDGMYLYTGKA